MSGSSELPHNPSDPAAAFDGERLITCAVSRDPECSKRGKGGVCVEAPMAPALDDWRARRPGVRGRPQPRAKRAQTGPYADGAGTTEGRLLGRFTLFHADDLDTTRSSAARAALESFVFAPHRVLPNRGVAWRAETEDIIVARFDVPPEHPEVRARIDEQRAIRTVSALRWGDAGEQTFQYIPFGGEVHAERRFGDLVLPSDLTVGWWFDTPRFAPFFKAHIDHGSQY